MPPHPHPRILILNAPCNGFGDVLFAYKLKETLERGGMEAVVVTTYAAQAAKSLALEVQAFDGFGPLQDASRRKRSCRRFAKLQLPENILQTCRNVGPFDVAIQAPIMYDHDVNWEDFSTFMRLNGQRLRTEGGLIAERMLVFSEYDHPQNSRSIVVPGLSKGAIGLLPPSRLIHLAKPLSRNMPPSPFTIMYLGGGIRTKRSIDQVRFFLNDYLPGWIRAQAAPIVTVLTDIPAKDPFWKEVTIGERVSIQHEDSNGKPYFPLPYFEMLGLWNQCTAPIMCSGDHTLTDAWYCTAGRLPLVYQVADWKQDFGRALADHTNGKMIPDVAKNSNRRLNLVVVDNPPSTLPDAHEAIMALIRVEMSHPPSIRPPPKIVWVDGLPD